ncbi:MAG: tRNA (guanosine(46)-N7)-methyltransferase TrmB, partial [bacterium]
MRVRSNPKALEKLEQYPELVYLNPVDMKNKWAETFGNDHPIYIEIGMGKGDFIIENARRYPEINFIGIEKITTILYKAVHKYQEGEPLDNLLFVKEDAAMLGDIFGEGEVDQIFLNFSDPWPKKRHEKRRLTYRSYIDVYKQILKPLGHIILKTDNRSLFEYTLVSF